MIKKTLILVSLITFLFPALLLAQERTTVYFFGSDSCPHCAAEKQFLEKLQQENSNIELKYYKISKNEESRELLQQISEELSINIPGVPITFIGNKFFIGYQGDEIQGELIKNLINEHVTLKCPDIVAPILDDFQKTCEEPAESQITLPEEINVPFLRNIKPKNFSLPFLTFTLAAIDGFNPCAMWVLIFLISLLLGMKNRKRMWLLGTTFIITSAAVYFLFLTAWLNFFLFLGFISWVRIIVALAAIGIGIYYLRKYFKDRTATCEISESEKQQKILEKLKAITQKEQLWLALGGIMLLAAAINLIELICSAGLPAVFTHILSLSELSRLQYYLYLLFYMLVFMLDDMLVFVIAMITLRTVNLTKKYSHYSALIGGILMAVIGLLLIFKPEWLMF